jgi:hypothetical protein
MRSSKWRLYSIILILILIGNDLPTLMTFGQLVWMNILVSIFKLRLPVVFLNRQARHEISAVTCQ